MKKKERAKLQQHFIDRFGVIGTGEALTECGLSRFAVYKWLKDPEFKRRYDEKLASYQFSSGELTDEEYNHLSNYWRMQPPWRLIQRMKINERMKQRRGEPCNIWW